MKKWKYSRKKLYYELEDLMKSLKAHDNRSWETDTKLKEFKSKIVERK
jgi:hypothetical protein